MSQTKKTLAIIGGGAAGLTAAVAAGDRARQLGKSLDIVVYERDDRVGRSILVTGNGRCNFSNKNIAVWQYHNSDFAGAALSSLSAQAGDTPVMDFLEGCGLEWRQEEDGRRYPLANKASVVVDVLRAAAAKVGASEARESEIVRIDAPRASGKPFTLRMSDGVFQRAGAVVVACGGKAVSSLEVAGVPCLPTRPVLGPLKVAPGDVPFTRELDNIRVKCIVSLNRRKGADFVRVMTEPGELMFRKYGVSGICVFNLSRHARPGDRLSIDFLQAEYPDRAEDYLLSRRKGLVRRFGEQMTYADMLRGLVLPRVGEALLKTVNVDPGDRFAPGDVGLLASLLQDYSLEVEGMANIDNCQVRRGGFDVKGFDPATMASYDIEGLFAAGEALDVDGPCGGYNLHWAWASGMLAGRCAANALLEGASL